MRVHLWPGSVTERKEFSSTQVELPITRRRSVPRPREIRCAECPVLHHLSICLFRPRSACVGGAAETPGAWTISHMPRAPSCCDAAGSGAEAHAAVHAVLDPAGAQARLSSSRTLFSRCICGLSSRCDTRGKYKGPARSVAVAVLAGFRAGVVLAAGLPYPSSCWHQVRLNGLPFSCDLMM